MLKGSLLACAECVFAAIQIGYRSLISFQLSLLAFTLCDKDIVAKSSKLEGHGIALTE